MAWSSSIPFHSLFHSIPIPVPFPPHLFLPLQVLTPHYHLPSPHPLPPHTTPHTTHPPSPGPSTFRHRLLSACHLGTRTHHAFPTPSYIPSPFSLPQSEAFSLWDSWNLHTCIDMPFSFPGSLLVILSLSVHVMCAFLWWEMPLLPPTLEEILWKITTRWKCPGQTHFLLGVSLCPFSSPCGHLTQTLQTFLRWGCIFGGRCLGTCLWILRQAWEAFQMPAHACLISSHTHFPLTSPICPSLCPHPNLFLGKFGSLEWDLVVCSKAGRILPFGGNFLFLRPYFPLITFSLILLFIYLIYFILPCYCVFVREGGGNPYLLFFFLSCSGHHFLPDNLGSSPPPQHCLRLTKSSDIPKFVYAEDWQPSVIHCYSWRSWDPRFEAVCLPLGYGSPPQISGRLSVPVNRDAP